MKSVDILDKLIAFDTVSHRSNLELMQFAQDYLKSHNVCSKLVYDQTGLKANLFATIGPENGKGIVLSGHTDVVSVEGQIWDTNPFQMVESNGKLYGRGTCDMKGFVASAMALVPLAVKAGLQKPIHLAFSYDEEIGCIGVRSLLKALEEENFTAELCIVGEPTMMDVVIAHKGKETVELTFHGKAAHSSLTSHGCNAIEYMAKAINKVREISDRLKTTGAKDDQYDVAYSTAQTGLASGGSATNIVPQSAQFVFEFRTLPEDDLDALVEEVRRYVFDELEPAMQAEHSECFIEWRSRAKIPGLSMRTEDEATILCKKLAGRNTEKKVAFGTEAGLFHTCLSIPTIVCGPGSIDQAHKPNEFIDIAQLDKCDVFLQRLLAYACQT